MARMLVEEYNTFMALLIHDDTFYARVSSTVYLTLADYEFGAKVLGELCERVRQGAWREGGA